MRASHLSHHRTCTRPFARVRTAPLQHVATQKTQAIASATEYSVVLAELEKLRAENDSLREELRALKGTSEARHVIQHELEAFS